MVGPVTEIAVAYPAICVVVVLVIECRWWLASGRSADALGMFLVVLVVARITVLMVESVGAYCVSVVIDIDGAAIDSEDC